MFSQVSVILSTGGGVHGRGVRGGGHMWEEHAWWGGIFGRRWCMVGGMQGQEGMHDRGGHVWQREGGICGRWGYA